MLSLEFGHEGVFRLLELLELRLVLVRLVFQLLDQALTLLRRLVAVLLLGARCGLGFAQACYVSALAPAKTRKRGQSIS